MKLLKAALALAAILIAVGAEARFPRGTPTAPARTQVNLASYGATCDGVADDTAAFLAFKSAWQGSLPVQLNLPGNCTYLPTGGAGQFPFKGVSDLIVAGNGTATSGIKNLAGGSQNFLFGGSGQYQDNAHSVRTNDANAGDSCVIAKTQPAVTVSAAAGNLAFTAVFTASASGTTLNVTAVTSGTITPGAAIGNLDSNAGFFNVIQPYGTSGTTGVGGTGTYALSTTATFSSQTTNTAPATFTATVDANGVMTVSAIVNGSLTVGAAVFSASGGIGGTGGTQTGITTIKSQLTGSAGSTGTYQLDNSPAAAIASPTAFQLQGQIRVTLNSTTGLSTGDNLYLSGMTGRGQLPQRVNGLKWIKVINSTQIDLVQWIFDGGYTSGGAGGGDRTSLFPNGSKVMMSGWINQAYWGAPYGYPSNPHWFEYRTVVSTNSGTHQICFDAPLSNNYKAGWPQYNTGSLFEVDPGGPATLYVLDPTWELTHVYKDFTLDNQSFQTTANGRNITWSNVKMLGTHCAIPTQNVTHTWVNIDGATCNIETDKIVGTWSLTNVTLNNVVVQSSSMDTISLDNVTADQWSGSPKLLTATNSSFNCTGGCAFSLAPGTASYGASDETICNTCTAATAVSTKGPIQRVDAPSRPWSMSGGVITIPNAYSWSGANNESELQVRGMVPGHYVVWQGSGGGGSDAQNGRIFKVVDVTQDLDNTYVQTSEAGGFPTGTWTTNGLSVVPHPAPKLTVSFTGGSANTALALNGCTAQAPMYSCQNFTYTGGAAGTTAGYRPTIWGVLDTFTITNNVPYTNTGSLTWQISQFNNWPILKTDLTQVKFGNPTTDLANGQVLINTKLPSSGGGGARTLTSSGASGTQAGDTVTRPPADAWFGGSSLSGPVFSANTPSDSPQVTMTLRTNQQLPP